MVKFIVGETYRQDFIYGYDVFKVVEVKNSIIYSKFIKRADGLLSTGNNIFMLNSMYAVDCKYAGNNKIIKVLYG